MPTIYIYCGTFDPFHNNHLAICQWCLEQPDIEKLYIHVNYRPPEKRDLKQPASWQTRVVLVQAALPYKKVEVSAYQSSNETISHIKMMHSDKCKLIQIMGDDVLESAKDKPMVDAYAVHKRNQYDADFTFAKNLFGKPLYDIRLTLPDISSTKIRTSIINHQLDILSSLVPPALFSMINLNPEYSPLSLSKRALKKAKIDIDDTIIEKLQEKFGFGISLRDETKQLKGLSGNTLISILNEKNTRIALCKIFKDGGPACQKEVDAYHVFAQQVRTPSIYIHHDNFLCIEYVEGKHATTPGEFYQLGIAYQQLHQLEINKPTLPQQKKLLNLEQKIEKLCEQLAPFTSTIKLKSAFQTCIDEYKCTPQASRLVHNDAQAGNSIIANDGSEVTFIDVSNESPWQDASRDVEQMISSIHWLAFKNNELNDASTIQENVDAFLSGYQAQEQTPRSPLWHLYFQTRMLINALNNSLHILSKPVINNFQKNFPGLIEIESSVPESTPFWQTSNKIEQQNQMKANALPGFPPSPMNPR